LRSSGSLVTTVSFCEPKLRGVADLRWSLLPSLTIAPNCGLTEGAGPNGRASGVTPPHKGSGFSLFHAQILRLAHAGSCRLSHSNASAVAGCPRSRRAASSLAIAALTASRLRRRELRSDVTTKLANCPANK